MDITAGYPYWILKSEKVGYAAYALSTLDRESARKNGKIQLFVTKNKKYWRESKKRVFVSKSFLLKKTPYPAGFPESNQTGYPVFFIFIF